MLEPTALLRQLGVLHHDLARQQSLGDSTDNVKAG